MSPRPKQINNNASHLYTLYLDKTRRINILYITNTNIVGSNYIFSETVYSV